MISTKLNQALIKKIFPIPRKGRPDNVYLWISELSWIVTAIFFCFTHRNGGTCVVFLFLSVNYLLGSRRKIAHLSLCLWSKRRHIRITASGTDIDCKYQGFETSAVIG